MDPPSSDSHQFQYLDFFSVTCRNTNVSIKDAPDIRNYISQLTCYDLFNVPANFLPFFLCCMITKRLEKSKPHDVSVFQEHVFTGSTPTGVHVNTPVHAGNPGPSKVMRSETSGNIAKGIL